MKTLNEILNEVEKPSRYTGGEYGEPKLICSKFNYCICFPDVYEVGMSNLGIKIVLDVLNKTDGVSADRCFAPWRDFGEKLKENDIELFSLGLKKPLKEFDMLGFSLQYEMSYSNVLYMLDLAHIPLLAKDRGEEYPIIQAGGPCACNGEPMADFIDLFVIGDGEESMKSLAELKLTTKTKAEFLEKAETIQGVYVPNKMSVEYNTNGSIKCFNPDKRIKKSLCKDLDKACFPQDMLVPNIEAVFDRAVIEVMRGCYRGCRFCQAGFLYRPVRLKSQENLIKTANNLIEQSGFDELSLNSLSTGDYPELKNLIKSLKCELKNVRLALPSLRLDSFDEDFAAESRKSSLTFAPEAGTQRLRNVINKDVTVEEIMFGVTSAFRAGYSRVKLYFMLGLPTETNEDLQGIIDLVYAIREKYAEFRKNPKSLQISVSVSTFIPKPWTPFQWERQATKEEVEQKIAFLKKGLFVRGVTLSWNDYDLSQMEAVFARGDRRLGKVLLSAYKKGCIFDGWNTEFKPELYREAFNENGISPDDYTREFSTDEILPWDFIDIFVEKEFLKKERERSKRGEVTGSCKKHCSACGMQKEFKCNAGI